jgi:hypothetical protein
MYDNAKSVALASAVKIDALSGKRILHVKLFSNTAAPTWQPSFGVCLFGFYGTSTHK